MSKETWLWRKLGISFRMKGMNGKPYLQARGPAALGIVFYIGVGAGMIVVELAKQLF